MLRALDPTSRTFRELSSPAPEHVHAAAPDEHDREILEVELGIPRDLLKHAIDVDEIARVRRKEGVRLIILRIPLRKARGRTAVSIVPLSFVLLGGRVVTISPARDPSIDELLLEVPVDPDDPLRGVLEIVLRVSETFLVMVRTIDADMDRLEDELGQSQRNEEVLGLLALQKDLIQIETALRSNKLMLDRLAKDPQAKLAGMDEDLLEDVQIELNQALEMATVQANELGSLMDAFASIISNNLNVVMKRLTSITMILTLPMLVASVWGMNVPVPMKDRPGGFLILAVVSVALSAGLLAIFRRQKWL